MRHRGPIAVFFLSIITLGIYALYWQVSTKNEMNRLGASIPTAWLILIPFVGGLYWSWKYCEGVGQVTQGQLSGVLAFVLLAFLGLIGMSIIQNEFNKLGTAAVAVPGGPQPVPAQNYAQPGQPLPDASFGGPATAPAQPVSPANFGAPVAPVRPVAPAAPATGVVASPPSPVADISAPSPTVTPPQPSAQVNPAIPPEVHAPPSDPTNPGQTPRIG